MRLRLTNQTVPVSFKIEQVWTKLPTGEFVANQYYPAGTYLHTPVFAWIRDDLKRPRKNRFGNVEHFRCETVLGDPFTFYQTYPNSADDLPTYVTNAYRSWFTPEALSGLPIRWSEQSYAKFWQSLIVPVNLNSILVRLRSKLSTWASNGGLAETLGELPEAPKLFQLWKKGKSMQHNLSGLYLNATFGWRPTLEVAQDVINEVKAIRRHVKRLRTRKDRVISFGEDFVPIKFETLEHYGKRVPSWLQTFTDGGRALHSHKARAGVMFHCTVTPRWGAYAKAMAHLHAINGIPSLLTLWQLLPRSFIIDWFVGVGDLISTLQGNLMYDIKVIDERWSLSYSGEYYQHWGSPGQKKNIISNQKYKYYIRSNVPPLGTWLIPSLGVPSVQVLPSVSALLLQRLPAVDPVLAKAGRAIPRRIVAETIRTLGSLGYRKAFLSMPGSANILAYAQGRKGAIAPLFSRSN